MEPQRTNPKNDRIKREYLIYLKDARQRSPSTVEQVRHAIDRLETYIGFKDFGTFNKERARGFPTPLSTNTGRHCLRCRMAPKWSVVIKH